MPVLFPFTTAWVDEHLFDMAPEITYGVVILLADISYAALARALVKVNGEDSGVARALCGFRKSKITFLIVGAGLAAGIFFPVAVVVSIALSSCCGLCLTSGSSARSSAKTFPVARRGKKAR